MRRLNDVTPAALHLHLMQVLTFTTGMNDAVGYLGLDRVFTGNMTGNVVILGMAMTGVDGLPVAGPALALAGFMVGAMVAGRTLRWVTTGWTLEVTVLLASVAAVMLAIAVGLWVRSGELGHWATVAITTSAALVLGAQAATARHIAVKDITTVVVTSTITGFAADSPLGNGRGGPWVRRLAAIALVGVGAATGAALLNVASALVFLVVGIGIAGVAVIGEIHRRQTAISEACAAI